MADNQDGIVIPKKISWAIAVVIVGIVVKAGLAEYRLRIVEDKLIKTDTKIESVQQKYLADSSNWTDSLRRIDKYLCKLCLVQVKDGCGICDD